MCRACLCEVFGHEFVPKGEFLPALQQAFNIFNV